MRCSIGRKNIGTLKFKEFQKYNVLSATKNSFTKNYKENRYLIFVDYFLSQ